MTTKAKTRLEKEFAKLVKKIRSLEEKAEKYLSQARKIADDNGLSMLSNDRKSVYGSWDGPDPEQWADVNPELVEELCDIGFYKDEDGSIEWMVSTC